MASFDGAAELLQVVCQLDQIGLEFTLIDAVTVGDVILHGRRELLQVAAYFTHTGVGAVVAIARVAVKLRVGLALLGHVVIDTAFAAQHIEEVG